MNISQKRKAGEILGRDGISSRIIAIANEIASGSYKDAIQKAGQISELVDAATFDSYWKEKAEIGKHTERSVMLDLNEGWILKDRAEKFVNPYLPS